jgi:hypothetical protein
MTACLILPLIPIDTYALDLLIEGSGSARFEVLGAPSWKMKSSY